jgi:hypothetical protein
MLAILDVDDLVDPDFLLVVGKVESDDGILSRDPDQSGDFPTRHLSFHAISALEFPPVHEDMKYVFLVFESFNLTFDFFLFTLDLAFLVLQFVEFTAQFSFFPFW